MTLNALQSPMERNALLMYLALATPGNHIIIVYAKNGVGKTQLTKQVAYALGVDDPHFKRMSLSRCQPEDFGWPVPSDEGVKMLVPFSLRQLNDGMPSVLFLDELGDANRTMQAAAHGLLDDRELGDEKGKPSLKIIGAMNPPEYSTDAQEMGTGFSNRCGFVPFESPSPRDFIAHRARRGRPQSFAFPVVTPEKRAAAREYVDAVAAAYFTQNPNAQLEEDPKDEVVAQRWPKAWASPRTWEYALEVAATCIAIGDRAAMRTLMQAFIGEPQALAFADFEADQDLLPGLTAANDPTLFTPDRKRMDRTFAQMMAVVEAVCDQTLTGKEAVELWNKGVGFLQRLRDCGESPWSLVPKEVAVIGLELLAEYATTHLKPGALLQKHESVIAELSPMVSASIAYLGVRQS